MFLWSYFLKINQYQCVHLFKDIFKSLTGKAERASLLGKNIRQ